MCQLQQDSKKSPLVWWRVMEVVILSIATVMLALCILVASLSSLPNADQFGFLDTTAEVFNGSQRTQISPAGWTFAIIMGSHFPMADNLDTVRMVIRISTLHSTHIHSCLHWY